MSNGQNIFDGLAQNVMKKSTGVGALEQFFRHRDFARERFVVAKINLHHGQIFGHRVQAGNPAIDALFESERPGIRKSVVRDHVRHMARIVIQRAVNLLG